MPYENKSRWGALYTNSALIVKRRYYRQKTMGGASDSICT
ncbi:hypothetical protein VPH1266_0075 [Vibrio phage 1266]